MKDNQNIEVRVTADTAEAEGVNAAAELGKFKDVRALMQAYQALEAEFTRRSQRLKELEANKESGTTTAEKVEAPSQQAEKSDGETTAPELTEEVKNAVIEEYLNDVLKKRGVPFVTGGGAVTAEKRTPKTMREAGALATKLFNNKEEL